jgi:outer membrane lipoprotein SlyB
MKTHCGPVALIALLSLSAGCTFPSSKRVVPSARANVMQTIQTGIVESVREVVIEGQKTNLGMYGGGLIGGAAASGVGQGYGTALASATAAVGGAIIGQATEELATRKRAQEIVVRLDSGQTVVITQPTPDGQFREGDRVRVANGGGDAHVALDLGS